MGGRKRAGGLYDYLMDRATEEILSSVGWKKGWERRGVGKNREEKIDMS
jgi:histidyl-tRNA synthetase